MQYTDYCFIMPYKFPYLKLMSKLDMLSNILTKFFLSIHSQNKPNFDRPKKPRIAHPYSRIMITSFETNQNYLEKYSNQILPHPTS